MLVSKRHFDYVKEERDKYLRLWEEALNERDEARNEQSEAQRAHTRAQYKVIELKEELRLLRAKPRTYLIFAEDSTFRLKAIDHECLNNDNDFVLKNNQGEITAKFKNYSSFRILEGEESLD